MCKYINCSKHSSLFLSSFFRITSFIHSIIRQSVSHLATASQPFSQSVSQSVSRMEKQAGVVSLFSFIISSVWSFVSSSLVLRHGYGNSTLLAKFLYIHNDVPDMIPSPPAVRNGWPPPNPWFLP